MSNLPAGHPPVLKPKSALLLINLGTPEGTDYWSIRRYLGEFLSDSRVIEVPRLIWFFILNLFILSFRPLKVARAYKKIWREETDESPLRYFTRRQAEELQKLNPQMRVEWAMRYGKPSIESKLKELKNEGCDRVTAFALYPQYSATTTATVYDECFRALMKLRWQPALRTLPQYHDESIYIEALSQSIDEHLAGLSWTPDKIILSFHGLPQSYLTKGDPYHCFCQKTGRLLRALRGWSDEQCLTCFQSRFGPEEWLQPYTDKTLEALAKEGVKNVLVVTPGFVSDCLETLEEIDILNRELFIEHGGENYSMVPCLNDSPLGIAVLDAVAKRDCFSHP